MTITDEGGLILTPPQLAVVRKPPGTKMLVTAGAGTGKTTTLARRIEHLVHDEGVEANKILALGFSRSAVRDLRDRLETVTAAASRVGVQTFDSWASSLLLQAGLRHEELVGRTFDDRIVMATKAIENDVVEESERGAPAHLVIDEAQDLVGVRREMVESLIDHFDEARHRDNFGFTVVGDAAQQVYGFQVHDTRKRSDETNRFFDWLRATYADELAELVLGENFRARTPEARIGLSFGAQLRTLPFGPEVAVAAAAKIYNGLRALLLDAPDFGSVDDPFVRDSLRCFDGTTAILCRDNAQVLLVSEQLNDSGVPYRLHRSPKERSVPPWVAQLLQTTDVAALTEDRFGNIMSTVRIAADGDLATVWRSLRAVAGGPRNQLDLTMLCRAVAEGRLPDELTAPLPHRLVLSTVHRAKGLEFDRVLVVEPDVISEPLAHHDDLPAEARLLYVAMTRARDDIYRFDRPDTWILRRASRIPLPVDRWYVGGREQWKRNGMESSEFDVCHEVPAGLREPFADPVDTQTYLLDCVHPGEPVELCRLHDLPMSPTETPPYGVFHAGRPIGEMSTRFRGDLWRLLKQSGSYQVKRWPYRITGLHIDAVETVAGFPSITQRAGIGDRGVWLAPRLCGLGRFDWTHAESVPEGDCAR